MGKNPGNPRFSWLLVSTIAVTVVLCIVYGKYFLNPLSLNFVFFLESAPAQEVGRETVEPEVICSILKFSCFFVDIFLISLRL